MDRGVRVDVVNALRGDELESVCEVVGSAMRVEVVEEGIEDYCEEVETPRW
jgi:hypothetical protein